jgi:hypothetical protein
MVKNYIFILVKINVLKNAAKLLQPNEAELNGLMPAKNPSEGLLVGHCRLCYVGGFIKRSEAQHLKKMLFRSARGKAFT